MLNMNKTTQYMYRIVFTIGHNDKVHERYIQADNMDMSTIPGSIIFKVSHIIIAAYPAATTVVINTTRNE